LITEAERGEAMAEIMTPMGLFLMGFFIMFLGMIILFVAALLQGERGISGAAIIYIGPIPILIGAGPHASIALLFAVIMTIVGFIVFFWLRKTKA